MKGKNEYKVFFPSTDGLVQAWSGSVTSTQENYMKECMKAVNEAVVQIKEKKITNVKELFEFLAGKRNQIANSLSQKDADDIGKFRTEGSAADTGIRRETRYEDQFSELVTQFVSLSLGNPSKDYSVTRKGQERINRTIEIAIKSPFNPEVILSKIVGAEDSNLSIKELTIYHTEISKDMKDLWDKINKEGESLFNGGLKTEDSIYEQLGKVGWLLAQFMPCKRSTSSIADTLCKTLLKYNHQELYPFNKDVNWDLQAIFNPNMEAFAEKYIHLYARTPKQLDDFLVRFNRLMLPRSEYAVYSQSGVNSIGLWSVISTKKINPEAQPPRAPTSGSKK